MDLEDEKVVHANMDQCIRGCISWNQTSAIAGFEALVSIDQLIRMVVSFEGSEGTLSHQNAGSEPQVDIVPQ